MLTRSIYALIFAALESAVEPADHRAFCPNSPAR